MVNERRLNERDYALMERLMLMKQPQVKKFLKQALLKYYTEDDLIASDDYIVAKGNIPIAVAAHMDTVWETSVGHEVFYDKKKNVMVNLRGGGYDDRVGCFMILKLLEFGYRPHVIFCADEEIGSLGAEKLVRTFTKFPFGDCNFIIMLDRRGINDCVFYDCENEEFEKYCEDFGFKTAWGSFTDICTLCPAWGMAGVNFSVGYVDEHTPNEKLYVGVMFETLRKVEQILSQPAEDIPFFNYIPSAYSFRGYRWNYIGKGGKSHHYWDYDYDDKHYTYGEGGWGYYDDEDICWGCGKDLSKVPEEDIIRVIDEQGFECAYCKECAEKYVGYCTICGQPYEVDEKHSDRDVCPNCFYDMMYSESEGPGGK